MSNNNSTLLNELPRIDGPRFVQTYLDEAKSLLDTLDSAQILAFLEQLCETYTNDQQIFVAGNGGSASTASHLVCDLGKTALQGLADWGARPFRAICLSDSLPLMTAWANDVSYDVVFAAQLRNLARPGDLLIVLSVSGNSPNIVEVAKTARRIGMKSVGLLGASGGRVRALLDSAIIVASPDYGHVENVHLMLNHLITSCLKDLLGSEEKRVRQPLLSQ